MLYLQYEECTLCKHLSNTRNWQEEFVHIDYGGEFVHCKYGLHTLHPSAALVDISE